jgi:hypothetical protein
MYACKRCLEIKRLYDVDLHGRWSDLTRISCLTFDDIDQSCDVCRILGAIRTTYLCDDFHDRMDLHFQPFGDDRKKVILCATLVSYIIGISRTQEIWVPLDPGKLLDSRGGLWGKKKD